MRGLPANRSLAIARLVLELSCKYISTFVSRAIVLLVIVIGLVPIKLKAAQVN